MVSASIQHAVWLDSVTRTYRQRDGTELRALDGVSVRVEKGSIHGVIGFSGAGKSTLVRCISRLERPDAGQVFVAGQDLAHLEGDDLVRARRKLGVVYQQLHLLRSRTVAANVALPLELAGWQKPAMASRVAELLAWFELSGKRSAYPAQLSGGQRQRVAVARALALSPDVLLTDEPTSALDPQTTASVLGLLRRVREEFGVTVLLISHDLEAVRTICDRVSVLDAGRAVEEGPVEQVFRSPEANATKRLLRSLSDYLNSGETVA